MKPLVLQHCTSPSAIGGPMSVLRLLMESELADLYRFETCFQDRPARGINIGLIREMAGRIREVRPDIFHVTGLMTEGFHAMAAARLARCRRVVLGVHGFTEDILHYASWRKLIICKVLEPLTVRAADVVYCVCEHGATKRVITRNARHSLGYIHNAIPTYDLQPPDPAFRASLGCTPDDVVAIHVARISRDKGLLDLQQAMALLHSRGIEKPKLLVVGDGPDFELISQRMKPLIESHRVIMLGRRDDVRSLLAISDFFVLPTLHENLSISILEAMSAGKAVLTTRVGGNPELVVDGETGVLVEPGNPEMLADALHSLSTNQEHRAEMGRAGRIRVEKHFSMPQWVKRIDAVYRELLQL